MHRVYSHAWGTVARGEQFQSDVISFRLASAAQQNFALTIFFYLNKMAKFIERISRPIMM